MKLDNIIWEGQCPTCKGTRYSDAIPVDTDVKTYNDGRCYKCKGTGTITRPATQEEVSEYAKKVLEFYDQDNLHPESITINGGILKIKD